MFSGSGSTSPGTVISTHLSGALTFNFTSDSSATGSGWDATIECTTLGTQDIEIPDGYIVYPPNPVTDLLRIVSKFAISRYEIYDINARLLSKEKINNETFTIDLKSVSSGVYFIKLFDFDGLTKNIKIIKQ